MMLTVFLVKCFTLWIYLEFRHWSNGTNRKIWTKERVCEDRTRVSSDRYILERRGSRKIRTEISNQTKQEYHFLREGSPSFNNSKKNLNSNVFFNFQSLLFNKWHQIILKTLVCTRIKHFRQLIKLIIYRQ